MSDLRTVAEALRAFVDDVPCRFDHHGACQSHGVTNPCINQEAMIALALPSVRAALSGMGEKDDPEGEPSVKTQASLDALLEAAIKEFDAEKAAHDLAERIPAIKVAIGKLRLAQKVSRALLAREITI